jgi:hypothetical protein
MSKFNFSLLAPEVGVALAETWLAVWVVVLAADTTAVEVEMSAAVLVPASIPAEEVSVVVALRSGVVSMTVVELLAETPGRDTGPVGAGTGMAP